MQRKLAVMVAALVALLMAPLSARAADCDSTVVDAAGVFGSRTSEVNAAVSTVVAKGAVVRLRTVRNKGGFANLDGYERSLVDSCPSWRVGGSLKNNLVIFILSDGDKASSGIWVGSTWASSIGPRWPTIQAQNVNPFLSTKGANGAAKPRDFVGGAVNGLNAVAASLSTQAAPSPQPYQPPAQAAPVQNPAPPPVVVQQQPGPDHTVLWVSVLVGLLAAGVLIWFLLSRKSQRDAANAAQQKAKVAKNACGSKINDMQEDVDLMPARVNKLAQVMSDEDVAPLREAADAIKRDYGSASSRYADLSGSATDPDKDGLSAQEYEQIAGGFNGVLSDLESVRQAKESFATKASALERTIGQAPTQITETETAIAAAKASIDEVGKTGFKVEGPNATLAEAESLLGQARTALAGKHFGQVAGYTAKAKDKAKAASAAAAKLAQTKADADAAVTALSTRIESVAGKVGASKTAFQQISAAYVESSWSEVRTNAADAEGNVTEARKFLAAATAASSMEKQNWSACDAAVKNGDAALDSAEASVKAISVRKDLLAKAQREAKADVDAAEADARNARAYASEHSADVNASSLNADLSAADVAVRSGKAELAKAKPDYLAAQASASTAKTKAASALQAAQKQVRAAEELRAAAAAAVTSASECIGTVAGYIAGNGDVTLDATRSLAPARASLARANAATTPASKIELAKAAKGQAEAVMTTAKGQVDAANERRRLAAEAEARRLAELRRLEAEAEAQRQREADAAAALLTGAVIGAAAASADRDSYERRTRRDDDDGAGRYGGGGSTDVDDTPSAPATTSDDDAYGTGGSTDADDSGGGSNNDGDVD